MRVVIRSIQKEETEKLVECMHRADHRPEEWSRPKIEKFLRKEGHDILIALLGTTIVGYVGLKEQDNEDERIRAVIGNTLDFFVCIEWIAVRPDHRSKGIASKLLAAAEAWARGRKHPGVWLDCRQNVTQLYEKNGYILAGMYEGSSKTNAPVVKYVFIKKI